MLHACTAIAYASKLDTANLPVPTAKILPAFQFNRCHLHKLYFTSDNIVILTTRKTQWRSSSASDPSTESNAARFNTVPLLTSMQNAHTMRSQVHWSIDNSTKHQLVKRASVPCHCERQYSLNEHLMALVAFYQRNSRLKLLPSVPPCRQRLSPVLVVSLSRPSPSSLVQER